MSQANQEGKTPDINKYTQDDQLNRNHNVMQ